MNPPAMTWLSRAEGLALFSTATIVYFSLGPWTAWWVYGLGLLAPYLAIAAYLAGAGFGAVVFNIVQSTIGPLILVALAFAAGVPLALDAAAIWLAHIGLNRALGLGRKRRSGLRGKRFGRIGGG